MKKQNRNQKSPINDASPVAMVQPPTVDEIRQRAHEIFQARGGAPGRELEDWLLAEQELKQQRVGTK